MFLTTFLYSQLLVTPPTPTSEFTGQTVIVTGSNTGLGFEAARHIARLHCSRLILAVRSVAKGQAAREAILASTKRSPDCIEVWELDMSSVASVQAFARRAQTLERVDAVVENAGVMADSFQVAPDGGFEQAIQVNVISTLLLALLLLPKLRETGKKFGTVTHLEIVTSEVHHMVTIKEADGPDLYAALNDGGKQYDPRDRYSISKALELLFVRELVKHTSENPLITLVNPGLCHSGFSRNISGVGQAVFSWFVKPLLARRTEVGARTLVAGVCAGAGSHGEYMSDCENQEVAAWVRSPRGVQVQSKVYEQTLAVWERIEPGISGNI